MVCHVSFSQADEQTTPLDKFTPFIGEWYAPDSVVQKNMNLKDRAIFKFEMDNRHSYIRLYENISIVNNEDYEFAGMVIPNPLSGKFEFFGVNTNRNFLFKGFFTDLSSSGFKREYDVYYPSDSYMAKNYGAVINFKEDFKLQEDGSLVFSINYYNHKNQKWEPWSDQMHVLVKK